MRNYYAEVISFLGRYPAADFRSIVFTIAQQNPKVLMQAIETLFPVVNPTKECRELYESGRRIEAIKKWRELTGAGLKEAKDKIDELAASEQWVHKP